MRPESHHTRRSAARAFGRKKRRPSHREKAARRRVRKRSQAGAPDRAACKRLSDALLRRGFSWQDIRPALSRLGEELPED